MIKAVGNAFASGGARRILPHHMVGRLDEIVADRLGRLGVFTQSGRVAADFAQWQ